MDINNDHILKHHFQLISPQKLTKSFVNSIINENTTNTQITSLIFYFISSDLPWDYKEIFSLISQKATHLNWNEIFLFDSTDFNPPDSSCFKHIFDIWNVVTTKPFPYQIFFKKWKNSRAQDFFITFYLSDPIPITPIITNIPLKYLKNIKIDHPLNSIEIFTLLPFYPHHLITLKKLSPFYTIFGLCLIYPNFFSVLSELFIAFTPENPNLIYIIFNLNPTLCITLTSLLNSNVMSLSRILDLTLEYKMLPYLSETLMPPYFCFDIIILSSRRDHLNLSLWITNTYANRKENFSQTFLMYLYDKFLNEENSKNKIRSEFSYRNGNAVQETDEFFPLNAEVIISIIQTLDILSKSFSRETVLLFSKFKNVLPLEIKSLISKKTTLDQHANEFISSIIKNKKRTDYIALLSKYVKGTPQEKDLALKIFSLLYSNFSSLAKVNSEILCEVYAKLLEKKILTPFYQKKILSVISNALKLKDTQIREYQFALKIFDMIVNCINDFPEFEREVREINGISERIGGEGIAIYEESEDGEMTRIEFYEAIYSSKNRIYFSRNKNNSGIINILCSSDSNCASEYFKYGSQEISISFETDLHTLVTITNNFLKKNPESYIFLVKHILNDHLCKEKITPLTNYLLLVKDPFLTFFIGRSLNVLYYIIDLKPHKSFALSYAQDIGVLIGRLTLSQNKIFPLEIFDCKAFTLYGIKKHRVILVTTFLTCFLSQSINSLVFKPNNPYILMLLQLLSNIYHSFGLSVIRERITHLFNLLNINVLRKTQSFSYYNYLTEYILGEVDSTSRHIISMAIDFSIREISTCILERISGIAEKTSVGIFYLNLEEDVMPDFMHVNTLMLNLVSALTHVTSHEPIKASICANISHFLKLANLEVEMERINEIADKNVELCCKIIEKVGISRILYGGGVRKVDDIKIKKATELLKSREIVEDFDQNDYEFDDFETKPINAHKQTKDISIEPNDLHKQIENINITQQKPTKEKFILFPLNISLLNFPDIPEKMELRPITLSEYNEIKNTLSNIGRRSPDKKSLVVHKEWSNYLATKKEEPLLEFLKKNEDLCEPLCQCIIGQLLKEPHSSKFIDLLQKVMSFSFRTANEVISWLIYADDERKYNSALITEFIKRKILNPLEYDQYMAKIVLNKTEFVLSVLQRLLLSDVKYCTPYDFIFTIEVLAKFNEEKYDDGVYEFLKNVSYLIIESNISTENINLEKISNLEGVFENDLDLNWIYIYIQISWDHFVRYSRIPSSYCYAKIDLLPKTLLEKEWSLAKEGIKIMINWFISSWEKGCYLSYKMFHRFIVILFRYLSISIESRNMVYSILKLFSPENMPFYFIGYLELVNEKITKDLFFNQDGCTFGVEICLSLLKGARIFNNDYVLSIVEQIFYKIFEKCEPFFVENSWLFSYQCPNKFDKLKNLLNSKRSVTTKISGNSAYIKILNALRTENIEKVLEVISEYEDTNDRKWIIYGLVDNLVDNNNISNCAIKVIEKTLNKFKEEIGGVVVCRFMCGNGPESLETVKQYPMIEENNLGLRLNSKESCERASLSVIEAAEIHKQPTPSLDQVNNKGYGVKNLNPLEMITFESKILLLRKYKSYYNAIFLTSALLQTNPNYITILGILYYESGQFSQALNILQSLSTTTSKYYESLCLYNLREYSKAIEILQNLISNNFKLDTPFNSEFDSLILPVNPEIV
ncbi:putative CCR4-NOT negative regulator of transcription, partial [Hamiltosporidium magnivora]